MFKRMSIMVAAFLAVVGGIAFIKVAQVRAAIAEYASFAPPPTAVTTAIAEKQKWQPVLEAVGTLKPVQGVVLSTDLSGIVDEILFESGASVKKGDVLVKLESSQEEAQLRSAEARWELARINKERQAELLKKNATSRSEFDAAVAEFHQSEAAVQEVKALIARKAISAPFDGVTGIRKVNVGQYINPGDQIVPLEALDPVYVEFSLPQQHLDRIKRLGKLQLEAEGVQGHKFEGFINAIDAKVEEATRNFVVQGTVRNPEGKLRSGMFVKVEVLLPEENEVIAIPASSLTYSPSFTTVFVVVEKEGPDGKPARMAEQRIVTTGQRKGDLVAILSGIKEGEEVITSGGFKYRDGEPVQVNNAVQPSSELSPQPPNT
jgi:membrane fusion protein (multidrug efflux system)